MLRRCVAISKQYLDEPIQKLVERKDKQKQRQQRYENQCGEIHDVIETKRDKLHLIDHRITVSKIGQRLNVRTAKKRLDLAIPALDPLSIESLNVAARKCSVNIRALPFR